MIDALLRWIENTYSGSTGRKITRRKFLQEGLEGMLGAFVLPKILPAINYFSEGTGYVPVTIEKTIDHDVYIDWKTGEFLKEEVAAVSSPKDIYYLLQDPDFREFFKVNIAAGQTDPLQYPGAQTLDPARTDFVIMPDGSDGPIDYKKKIFMGGNNCGGAEITAAAGLMAYLTQSRIPAGLNVGHVMEILAKEKLGPEGGMMYCNRWYKGHQLIFDYFNIPAKTLDSPSHYPTLSAKPPLIPNEQSYRKENDHYRAWFKTKYMIVEMTDVLDKMHREDGAVAPMVISIRPDKSQPWFNHFILSLRSQNISGTPHFDPCDPKNYFQYIRPGNISVNLSKIRVDNMKGWIPGEVDFGQLGFYSMVNHEVDYHDGNGIVLAYGVDAMFAVMPDTSKDIRWKKSNDMDMQKDMRK